MKDITLEDYIKVANEFDLPDCIPVILKTLQYQMIFNNNYLEALEITRFEYKMNQEYKQSFMRLI